MLPRVVKVLSVAVAAFFLMCLLHYLFAPLSPPKVTLKFCGLVTNGNDVVGLARLTNEGSYLVWCNFHRQREPEWHAEIETNKGCITNRFFPIGAKIPSGLLPSSNLVCRVPLPYDTIRWRVTSYHSYYDRHHVRYELADYLLRTDTLHLIPQPIQEVMTLVFRVIPEPTEKHEAVISPWFTNALTAEASK